MICLYAVADWILGLNWTGLGWAGAVSVHKSTRSYFYAKFRQVWKWRNSIYKRVCGVHGLCTITHNLLHRTSFWKFSAIQSAWYKYWSYKVQLQTHQSNTARCRIQHRGNWEGCTTFESCWARVWLFYRTSWPGTVSQYVPTHVRCKFGWLPSKLLSVT